MSNLVTSCRECNLGKSTGDARVGGIDAEQEVHLRSSQLERAQNRVFVKQLVARIADHMRVN